MSYKTIRCIVQCSVPFLPMMIMKLIFLSALFCIVCPLVATAQPASIIAGPMVGHVDMREASVWVQTNISAYVTVEYYDSAAPARRFTTAHLFTNDDRGHTATFRCDSVEPGRTYQYDVLVNGQKISFPYPLRFRTQPVWKWQTTDMPQATIALGSCLYVNETGYERSTGAYGSDYGIITAINAKAPDVMLWLGDNVYLREPDWNSRSGMFKRYSHTRAMKELQPLLASCAHYATWDDHDYGPDNADRSWWGKDNALEVFKAFWPNPSYGISGQPGIATSFSLLDADVFILDDRYYRAPFNRKDGERTILGEHQIQWLIDNLVSSQATFKLIVVGSQFITDNVRTESFARFPLERKRILDLIAQNDIRGVLFITGDIHATELSMLERPGTYPIYDFTSSALTAGANNDIAQQANSYRVKGTAVGQHNFGLITISGPAKARQLMLSVCDKDGNELWQKTINEADLR